MELIIEQSASTKRAIDVSFGTRKFFIIKEDFVDENISKTATWLFPKEIVIKGIDMSEKGEMLFNRGYDDEVEIKKDHNVYVAVEACEQACFEINRLQGEKYAKEIETFKKALKEAEGIAGFYEELITNPKAKKTTQV